MAEVKYNRDHHAGATPEARITNRLRNSGDAKNADHVVQKGSSPTRTFSNVFNSGHKVQKPNPPYRGNNEGGF